MFRLWKKKSDDATALIGEWRLVRSEGGVDVAEGVTILFTDDGKPNTQSTNLKRSRL